MTTAETPGGEPRAHLLAKATNAEISTAVVVSFHELWLRPMSQGHISLVLRKRVPQLASPKWMYIYVNSPESVLLARAAIKKILTLSLEAALKRRKESALTNEEIRSYLRGSDTIGAYELARTEIAHNPLRLAWLRKTMTFNPPQSFFFLAPTAQAVIDKHGEFGQPTKISKGK